MSVDSINPALEAAILSRIIDPESASLAPEAARCLLLLDFPDDDRQRMRSLAAKAEAGTLTKAERAEAESYNHVAHLLALLQSKARLSLKKTGLAS